MNDELQSTNDELRSAVGRVDELNHFLEAVLGSLESAVVVVDEALTVVAWNTAAAELWGVRGDEAVGRRLPELDIGLPLDDVTGLLGSAVVGLDPGHSGLTTAAVNRRGRTVTVRVTVSPLRRPDGTRTGGIIVMDVVPPCEPV